MFSKLLAGLLTALTLLLGSTGVYAQELRVGLSADVTSLDPHFVNATANNGVAEHIFDKLVHLDADSRLIPGLALSWRTVNPTTWEFKLRPNVKFHDGSDLTAQDVAFSVARPATIKNSPGPFTSFTRAITEVKVIDPLTIQFVTATPYPLLANDLTQIYIVQKRAAETATTDDFNLGKATVGTGPFKFVRFERGVGVQLERNDAYWGGRAAWDKVNLRILPNDSVRLSALLSGDVQVIDNIPPNLLSRVRENANYQVFQKTSHRLIFIYLDQREKNPGITDNSGKVLEKNPFSDVRVRTAISKLIDRNAIVDRVMEKVALPTANLVPAPMFGHSTALRPETFDPEGAKKLLAEAGYPDGFRITFFATNNRYVNDDQIAQAVGQMLSRGGIQTQVQTMPIANYLPRGAKREMMIGLLGWGAASGESSNPLRNLIASTNPERGLGGINWGSYSNARVDALVNEALTTIDNTKREALLRQATEIAMREVAIIPLHHQQTTWATRKGITFVPRTDELTLSYHFRPQ